MELLLILQLFAVAFAIPASQRDPMINEGLFEGDILGIDPDADRNAVPDDSRTWPGGVIPYIISPEREDIRDNIREAMDHIEKYSCITFVPRTTETDYINIIMGNGCYSHWGRTGKEQPVSLGGGCGSFGIIVHELMHAIGFEHEHNRSDRDEHLIINWDNIEPKWFYAFRQLWPQQNRLLSEFDFSSIMLYGSRSFAKDFYSENYSMVRKDGATFPEVYEKEAMSILATKQPN